MSEKFASILALATDPNSAESGGGHGNKGSDFQRYWGIWRALKLEEAGSNDFLLLFECVQDVLELDSSVHPTAAKVYQVKKKDSGEWTWNSLTLLPEPDAKPRKQRKTKDGTTPPAKNFSDSILGIRSLSWRHFPYSYRCQRRSSEPIHGRRRLQKSCMRWFNSTFATAE